MTGLEWQACEDPRPMVEALRRRGGVTDRKWRLFAAAFWRWHAAHLGESREEVLDVSNVMEEWAETGRLPRGHRPSASEEIIFFAVDAAQSALHTVQAPFGWLRGGPSAARFQAELLRDLFGNPFRTVTIPGRWRSSNVMELARVIHENRAFDRLPILADALMDAGCEDERILGHCHSPGPHVRGCWALDLLLATC